MTGSDWEQIERELAEELGFPADKFDYHPTTIWDALLSRETALREAREAAKEAGYGSGSLASVINNLADCSAKAMKRADAAEIALREEREEVFTESRRWHEWFAKQGQELEQVRELLRRTLVKLETPCDWSCTCWPVFKKDLVAVLSPAPKVKT